VAYERVKTTYIEKRQLLSFKTPTFLTTFVGEFAFRAVYCDHETQHHNSPWSSFDSPPFCIQDKPPDVIPFKSDYLSSLLFPFLLVNSLSIVVL